MAFLYFKARKTTTPRKSSPSRKSPRKSSPSRKSPHKSPRKSPRSKSPRGKRSPRRSGSAGRLGRVKPLAERLAEDRRLADLHPADRQPERPRPARAAHPGLLGRPDDLQHDAEPAPGVRAAPSR